jgi:hypothetical protein
MTDAVNVLTINEFFCGGRASPPPPRFEGNAKRSKDDVICLNAPTLPSVAEVKNKQELYSPPCRCMAVAGRIYFFMTSE